MGSAAADVDFTLLPGESKAVPKLDSRIGKPKKILVIGGGPAGLISLHELLNPANRPEGSTLNHFQIQLYERMAEVGGVWYVELEESEEGCSKGLFRWDAWRQGVGKGLRAVKESELRRLCNANLATERSTDRGAASVGRKGVGDALTYGLDIEQKFAPESGCERKGRGRSLWL